MTPRQALTETTPVASDATDLVETIDLSVVIVTYNSVGFIDRCLASVQQSRGNRTIETIVVDNASLDGSPDHIEAQWPEVTVIRAGWNSGFSRACNLGAEAATGTRILFLNGDAELAPDAAATLLDSFDNLSTAGVLAPRVLNPDGSDQRTARTFPSPSALIWGRRSPLTARFPNNRWSAKYLSGADPDSTEPFEVDWVSGAALLMNLQQFNDLGRFDEGFFMYWEDADLCRRVKAHGQTVWCIPAATAVHAEGSSAATTSKLQNKRFHRSAYRYVTKHMLTGPALVLRPLARLALWLRSLGVSMARRRNERTIPPTNTPLNQELDNGLL